LRWNTNDIRGAKEAGGMTLVGEAGRAFVTAMGGAPGNLRAPSEAGDQIRNGIGMVSECERILFRGLMAGGGEIAFPSERRYQSGET
jgi:hypothetical protein